MFSPVQRQARPWRLHQELRWIPDRSWVSPNGLLRSALSRRTRVGRRMLSAEVKWDSQSGRRTWGGEAAGLPSASGRKMPWLGWLCPAPRLSFGLCLSQAPAQPQKQRAWIQNFPTGKAEEGEFPGARSVCWCLLPTSGNFRSPAGSQFGRGHPSPRGLGNSRLHSCAPAPHLPRRRPPCLDRSLACVFGSEIGAPRSPARGSPLPLSDSRH